MISTDFLLNPGEGTRYLVNRYRDQLIETILKDIQNFDLKVNLKAKSLCQLYTLIVCVEEAVKPHAEKILKQVVYKLILDEEPDVAQRTYKIVELLGLFI